MATNIVTTDTRITTANNLIRQESIQYIRPQVLKLTLSESRPNTELFIFFGETNVTHLCNLVGEAIGSVIYSDSIGSAEIEFHLPGGKFNVGNYEIMISESNNFEDISSPGSSFGFAKTTFSASGVLEIYQPVTTTTVSGIKYVDVNRDPLAQSFFTYGVTGGMFLSSIDIYFQSKDDSLPVRCEIRELVNGYPSSVDASSQNLISILAPSQVNVSNTAIVSTKFPFEPPLYLKENGEYCFVLRSNSKKYHVYTSKLGENSIETGKKIYDQPYVGSLFKSENAVTWTAEQTEDIKFKINKAVFQTEGNLDFYVEVPPLGALGGQFYTTANSNIIRYTHLQDHGLEVDSVFRLETSNNSNSTFNGIPYSEFNGIHTVISADNRKTLTFAVSSNASSTGALTSANVVTHISVINEGINYNIGDTITISGGGGSGANATLNIIDGNIKSVNIANTGIGYTSAPTISINSSSGSGGVLLASVTPTFNIKVNKPMTGFIPKMSIFNHGSSKTVNALTTTIGNYDGGNLISYSNGILTNFVENIPYVNMGQNSLIASSFNESAFMANNMSTKVSVQLISSNPNVSPVVDTNTTLALDAHSYIINSQPGETISANVSNGSVSSIVITNAGSLYTLTPNVTIDSPDLIDGVQSTANVTLSGGSISNINIINPGSGYLHVPSIIISRAVGDTTGDGGAAQAVLTNYNSELLPSGGLAKAKYITKLISLQIISTGVRLFSVLSSTQNSSVDWYIRTSLSASGEIHEEQEWKLLQCDYNRNRSSYIGEMIEYEFKLDDIDAFDTYDLKCVMLAQDPTKSPIVKSYRVIVVA